MDKKRKKRKKIIEVATKLFVERGFHGTPTSLIAKEAGIATGTLFNYFKTKDILINEIYIEIGLEQKKWTIKGLGNEKNLKGKLKKIWNNLIVWAIKNPYKRRFGRYFSDSSFINDETKIELRKNYKFIFEIFIEFIEKKKMKNIDALMLVFNFIGSCIFTSKYFHEMNKLYDEKVSDESFERFCKGIDLTDED